MQNMNQKRSLFSYRMLDLALFAGILVLFESIIIRVSNGSRFAGQPYTVSLAAAITGIMYMRWGAWGALHAALAGLVFCLMQKAVPEQYLIYIGGNLVSLIALPLYHKLGRENIRNGKYLFIPVSLSVLILMQAGRALLALLLGAEPNAALLFFTTDCMSAVFTLLITWIAKQQNGLYEDQIHYLKRIEKESREEEDHGESN